MLSNGCELPHKNDSSTFPSRSLLSSLGGAGHAYTQFPTLFKSGLGIRVMVGVKFLILLILIIYRANFSHLFDLINVIDMNYRILYYQNKNY